jgi:hypothetical protein
MKTVAEEKFDMLIKEGVHQILKPLGFRKKGNNFYLQLEQLGQIINLQKSLYYSKDHIHFTINIGLFIPEFWLTYYTFHNGEIPAYPTEPTCAIRTRIGHLKCKRDTWFDVNTNSDMDTLLAEMKDNVTNYILPYFERAKTRDDIIFLLDNRELPVDTFTRLVIYGEYKNYEKAKNELERLESEKNKSQVFKERLLEYREKYGL